MVGVERNMEDSLWIRMERADDSSAVEELQIAGGKGTECLYLPPALPGRYLLRASLQRGGPWLAEANIVRSDTVMIRECDENYFWIGSEGFLLDAVSGQPVESAEVLLTDSEGETLVSRSRTDSVGAYRFSGLEPWKEYSVDAGTQSTGILLKEDYFIRDQYFGDTLRIACRGFLPEARLLAEDGREAGVVHFELNEFGVGEAMLVQPRGKMVLYRTDGSEFGPQELAQENDDEFDQYHYNQREFRRLPSDGDSLRFRVADFSGRHSRVPVHAEVMRIGEPRPWRMSTFISIPIGADVIHHSIDSAEFARRFPYLLMDTMSRHSLSEQPNMTLAASYDFEMADGDSASIGLDKLDSGLYRIILEMPLPEGDIDSVERLYYHYCTPGYRLGSGPFYAYNISGQSHAVGDTLRVKVGSCYSGVTVICQVEENGKVVEVKQLHFDNDDTILCQPLRQRGVVQMKFLSIWQGEFESWSARVDVGRTRLDWYWDDLYPYETFDLSGQFIDMR